jgi:cyclase
MIDSPMIPTDSLFWREIISTHGKPLLLINTHYHIDHVTGNFYFDVPSIAHEYTQSMFDQPISEISNGAKRLDVENLSHFDYISHCVNRLDPESDPLLEAYELSPPTIGFGGDLSLTIGETQFDLLHTPGHTPGDIGVFIPEERVYIAGDTVTNGQYPALGHCMPRLWIESLERIESLEPEIIVPGHGRVCSLETLREFKGTLQSIIEEVEDVIDSGQSQSEAEETVTLESAGQALHADEQRHRTAIRRLYDQLKRSESP